MKQNTSDERGVNVLNESNSYKKSILNVSIIDDDIIIRSLLSRMLKSVTFDHLELNIKVFENGPSFLQSEHAKEDINHFLILDGVMPMMDGIEVLQRDQTRKKFQPI